MRPVDPSDIQWEEDAPVFRLTYWRRQIVPPEIQTEHAGYEARELEISGAEVGDVLAWAQGEASADETFTLHVLVRSPDLGLGQILITGTDPTVVD